MNLFKKSGFLIIICLFAFSAAFAGNGGKKAKAAEEKGIQFTEGNWASILKKAKKEKKMIFFDAYASWCGPCKLMEKKVFTQAEVGDYFNKNFINVRFDMEEGEGPMLAKKYPLQVYPTLFIINADGKLVKTVVGYQDAEKLLKFAASVNKAPVGGI